MYESMTYSAILASMLDGVDDTYDKREGSVIYNALAPAAAQLAQAYLALDATADRGFVDTATENDLDKKAAERGLNRTAATCAVRKGLFYDASGALTDVDIGKRFSGGGLVYAVTAGMSTGIFKLTCETTGTEGNTYFGTLLPVEYIFGLGAATLSEVLTAGENEETDDALRERYYDNISSQAFGGNIADYKEKVNAISGIGGVKVTPVWNGGGTVKLTVITSDYGVPSDELIETVQTTIDPAENAGEGYGLAPIGHVVTVVGVSGTTVDVTATVTLGEGYEWNDISSSVTSAITSYFAELAENWADSTTTYVRISKVEQAILSITGVEDVQNTTVNGSAFNLTLDDGTIPAIGTVTVTTT
ncbi:MAG: putative phage Mu protein gp47-like protein [Oscillospiraceae bacterium]|nr:putative phage Mu protein gp47-like protein [Oscillospiraceae bacterium]